MFRLQITSYNITRKTLTYKYSNVLIVIPWKHFDLPTIYSQVNKTFIDHGLLISFSETMDNFILRLVYFLQTIGNVNIILIFLQIHTLPTVELEYS